MMDFMSAYETAEVPFHKNGNRLYLDSVQLEEQPWLAKFVEAFPNCFEFSFNEERVYYYPNGK